MFQLGSVRSIAKRIPLSALAGFVLLAALAIRLDSISSVLPMIQDPDEPRNDKVALRVAHHMTKSPGFFNYPSLLFYVQAALARAYEARTGTHLEPAQSASTGVARTDFPGHWILGRAATACFGAGIAAFAVLLAGVLSESNLAGLVAGLWVALSPALVIESRFITPDTYAAFFAIAAVYGAVLIAAGATWQRFLFAGLMTGLAAGSKYNLALVGLAVVVAQLSRDPRRGLLDWRLYFAGTVAVAAFVAYTPFAILDFGHFRAGLLTEVVHYRTGHAGAEGASFGFNLRTLWQSERWRWCFLPLLALLRGGRALRGLATVLGFVIPYFALLSTMEVHFARNLTPLIGPLLALAAVGLALGARALPAPGRLAGNPLLPIGVALALSVQPWLSILYTIEDRRIYRSADASRWIAEHIPPGSHLALEAYAPWVDRNVYKVKNIRLYGELSERERRLSHQDYVVLSASAYGRFYADRKTYAAQIELYETLMRTHCEVIRLGEASAEFRIFDLHCTPH